MGTVEAKPLLTPDDLLKMPDGDRYELVDGHLVERNTGQESSAVGGELLWLLKTHCKDRRLGWVFPADNGYQCFPDRPNLVRRPDVSFVGLGRYPENKLPEGYSTIPPDLAVEVVSPNDITYETDEKVQEYLGVGVRLVWVVNPKARTVLVYGADGTIRGLREDDELDGEDVIPGFRCRVGALFATPGGA